MKNKYGFSTSRKTPEDAIIEALENAGGVMAHAAKQLGISRQSLSKRVKKSPRLQEKVAECKEAKLDIAESELMKLIKKGNLGAICFYLKCIGKDRGYIENPVLNDQQPGAIGNLAASLVRLGAQLQRELEGRQSQVPTLDDDHIAEAEILEDMPALSCPENLLEGENK